MKNDHADWTTNTAQPNTDHEQRTSYNQNPIRNRIKTHRKDRAGDLVPHEWNYRLHPEAQKAALAAIYQEVGFARNLLAYELPDGRLKRLVWPWNAWARQYFREVLGVPLITWLRIDPG